MSSMKAPPSSAYKIVQVPEMYASIIAARGVEGGYIGGSEEESPWVPFGDNAAIRHLAFDVRANVLTLLAITGVIMYWRGVWSLWRAAPAPAPPRSLRLPCQCLCDAPPGIQEL